MVATAYRDKNDTGRSVGRKERRNYTEKSLLHLAVHETVKCALRAQPLIPPPNGLRGNRYATSPGLERLPYWSGPVETSQPQISPETTQTGSDFPEKTQPGLPAGKPLRDPRGNPDRTLAGESLTRALLRRKSQPNRRLGAKGRLRPASLIYHQS